MIVDHSNPLQRIAILLIAIIVLCTPSLSAAAETSDTGCRAKPMPTCLLNWSARLAETLPQHNQRLSVWSSIAANAAKSGQFDRAWSALTRARQLAKPGSSKDRKILFGAYVLLSMQVGATPRYHLMKQILDAFAEDSKNWQKYKDARPFIGLLAISMHRAGQHTEARRLVEQTKGLSPYWLGLIGGFHAGEAARRSNVDEARRTLLKPYNKAARWRGESRALFHIWLQKGPSAAMKFARSVGIRKPRHSIFYVAMGGMPSTPKFRRPFEQRFETALRVEQATIAKLRDTNDKWRGASIILQALKILEHEKTIPDFINLLEKDPKLLKHLSHLDSNKRNIEQQFNVEESMQRQELRESKFSSAHRRAKAARAVNQRKLIQLLAHAVIRAGNSAAAIKVLKEFHSISLGDPSKGAEQWNEPWIPALLVVSGESLTPQQLLAASRPINNWKGYDDYWLLIRALWEKNKRGDARKLLWGTAKPIRETIVKYFTSYLHEHRVVRERNSLVAKSIRMGLRLEESVVADRSDPAFTFFVFDLLKSASAKAKFLSEVAPYFHPTLAPDRFVRR